MSIVELNQDTAALVTSEKIGSVLRLEMNNPPANALSVAMMQALKAKLDATRQDKSIRAVIIASATPGKLFSAGHDLKELTLHRADEDRGRAFFARTAFCTPGVNIGLFCSTPMVALSRNVHRKQAMEMLLTGETIDASTAREFGLINRIMPRQYLNQVVMKYADVIASKSPLTVKIGKEAFYRQAEMSLEDAYEYTAGVMVENMMARDAEEGIGAFIAKRTPEWTGE